MRPGTVRMLALLLCTTSAGCAGRAQPRTDASPKQRTVGEGAHLLVTARTMAAQGDDVRAEQYFNAARRAQPPAPSALPELIALCVRATRLRAAMGYAQEQLRAEPSNVRLAFLIANLHRALDQPGDALRSLDEVLRAAPRWAEALHLRALLLRDDLADYASAAEAFRRYLPYAPPGPDRQEAIAFLASRPQRPARSARGQR